MKYYFFFFLLPLLFSCKNESKIQVKINRDLPEKQPAVIEINLPDPNKGHWNISGKEIPQPIPLQKTGENQWCFIPPKEIVKESELEIIPGNNHTLNPCTISRDENFITAKIDGQEILKYAVSTQYPSDTLPDYYKRSGFIHPLKTLQGATLTAGFPHGHVHQHGIFHAWTRSHLRDTMIDFWNQQALLGDIRHKEVMDIGNGPVFSSFSVILEYLAYFAADTLIASEEEWNIRIFPMEDHYLVDWQLQQKCLGPDSLAIDEYHYGGAAFRGSEMWNMENGTYDSLVFITTSEGKSQINGNHSRPEWVSMHGVTENGYGGIVMYQHPENFRFPQPVRIHPTMPYFCFAPMVLGKFVLQPGDLYEAKFRFLVFDGKPDQKLIEHYAAGR